MGAYNCMDCIRCFLATVSFIMGVELDEYDDAHHKWFIRRESKKYREDARRLQQFFGRLDCSGLTQLSGNVRCHGGYALVERSSLPAVAQCSKNE